jgi:hypothetical protein
MATQVFTDKDKQRLGIPTGPAPGSKSIFQSIGEGAKVLSENARANQVVVNKDNPKQFDLVNPALAEKKLAELRAKDAAAGKPVTAPGTPATAVSPPAAAAAAAPTSIADAAATQAGWLTANGVNNTAQQQDPAQFNGVGAGLRGATIRNEAGGANTAAIRTPDMLKGISAAIGSGSPQARLGQEALTNTQHVNLGNFGTEGGPNIYGRADENSVGGRINNFTGVGTPSEQGSPGVYNPTGYDNANPYGTSGSVPNMPTSLRAGNRQFGGGAGSGGGGDLSRQVASINSRADKAFNDALEAGMNTKAAARIAGSIRDGATQLIGGDRNSIFRDQNQVAREQNEVTREGNAMNLAAQQSGDAASTRSAELKSLGDMAKLDMEQQEKLDNASLEDIKGTYYTADAEGNRVADPEGYANALANAGGRSALQGLSGSSKFALLRQGSNIGSLLGNVNRISAKNGIRYDNVSDLLKGGKDGQRVSQTHSTLLEMLLDPNISDFMGETLTLPDGNTFQLADLIGDEAGNPVALTQAERDALIELAPED